VDVLAGEVRVLSQNLLGSHAVGHHRDDCRDREAQPADAGQVPMTSGPAVMRSKFTLRSRRLCNLRTRATRPVGFYECWSAWRRRRQAATRKSRYTSNLQITRPCCTITSL
jgi:hypothetical protein